MAPRHDEPRKPSLRISHIVHGRAFTGRRVKYLVDPNGQGEEREIPENVVLVRWRRRKFPGYSFSGCRLSSTLWRALLVWLGPDVEAWPRLTSDVLEARRIEAGPELEARDLRVPPVESAKALFQVCGARRLHALVERHAAFDGRSGVPDLFLFARETAERSVMARFVEVKKPDEPVSEDQHEEIEFMIGLGLHARVLRLIERE
jgi:hypothetical protein